MDDIAEQPTISLWRDRVPRVPRPGRRVIALVVLASLLFGVGAYGVGYVLGHAQGSRGALGAQATPTQGSWVVYWRHEGAGRELVTPPALDARSGARVLLAWGCGGVDSMTISVQQPPDSAQLARFAFTPCPGYGDVALSLQYGAWGVLVDAPGDEAWIITVARKGARA